ncbi:MAG: hypothetical protein J5965_24665 [Aeriscardovia sp.]|nr:hypothetical protein [Aeriscardovia sp.]
MWIAFVVWLLIIIAVAIGVLFLAKAESEHGTFSARIPDGEESEARRAQVEEQRREAARVVAPGMKIAPRANIRPGSTATPGINIKPVVATSSRVVEVKSLMQSHEEKKSSSQPAIPQPIRPVRIQPHHNESWSPSLPLPQRQHNVQPTRHTTSEEDAASPLLAHLVSQTKQKEQNKK